VLFAAAACSGGAGVSGRAGAFGDAARAVPAIVASGEASAAPSSANPAGANSATGVQIVVNWPPSYVAAARGRRPAYVSKSTASVAVVVDRQTPVIVDNPAVTGSPVAQSTVTVTTRTGRNTFEVSDYASTGGTGALLARATVPFEVRAGQKNVVGMTLNGDLASIACAAIAPFVSGTGSALTQVGPAGKIALLPEDAGGNVIVAPGVIPRLSLSMAGSQGTLKRSSTDNTFDVTLQATNVAASLAASGKNLSGSAVTAACTDTRVPALYVTNHGSEGENPSVTIYPATASGAATPTATLAGSKTDETQIQFAAVDPQGYLYVTNQGPMPGATYGPQSGYVTIYAPGAGQAGNQAPVAFIRKLDTPEGIAFDASGNLYVLTIDSILEYAPGLAGARAAPINTIAGADTNLVSCYGMFVDAGGLVYTACSSSINVFAAGASGNATPTEIQLPATGTTTFGSDSWLSVAADASGEIYAPAFNNQEDRVDGFPAGSSGATTPTFEATGFSQPLGIFVDASGNYYVANYGNSSIDVFTSESSFELGATAATSLSGSGTGLNYPYGVYVR
jgi:sugar lactone lactonase YvrE